MWKLSTPARSNVWFHFRLYHIFDKLLFISFFATVWTTIMVIFSKKKTVIIILNMMCFNLHLYFKVFYTNLSFMEQFYIKKTQNNSIIIFLENLLTKLPVVFKLGICRSLVWFFFHRTWSFNRSYTVALEANWKNWTTRQKKTQAKKSIPPRGSNAHVYMYACKTKCLIDINNFTRHENLHVVIMDYHKYNIAKAV